MRRHGTGTVEKAGSMWRFRCPNGAGGRYTSPAEYPTEKAALKGLAIYRQKITSGELTPIEGITLAQYVADRWLPRMDRDRPRSVRTYRSNWRSQISKAPFAKRPLRILRRRDVRAWIDGMSIKHPEHPAGVLKTILYAAVDDELIATNVAANLRIERKERPDTCPTPEEQAAIRACVEIPVAERLICDVLGGAALRPGEAWNHHIIDTHAEGADPYLWIRFGTKGGPPKNGKPRRVPLFGVALEAVRAWLRLLPSYAPHNPHGLLFPFADGRRRPNTHPFGTLERRDLWHVYRERAGIVRPIRLHDFRHAAATDLLNGERGRQWSTPEVQRLLDHASLVTTERSYIHRKDVLLERAAAEHRQSVQSGPAPIAEGPEIKGPESISQQSPSSSANPPNGPISPAYAEIASGWTDAGLLAEIHTLAAQIRFRHGGQHAAQSIGHRIRDSRRGADRIELAVARLDGPHWRAAVAELIDLLGAALASPTPSRKGGAA